MSFQSCFHTKRKTRNILRTMMSLPHLYSNLQPSVCFWCVFLEAALQCHTLAWRSYCKGLGSFEMDGDISTNCVVFMENILEMRTVF